MKLNIYTLVCNEMFFLARTNKAYCWRERTKRIAEGIIGRYKVISEVTNTLKLMSLHLAISICWWIEIFLSLNSEKLKHYHVVQQQTCVDFLLILIFVNIAINSKLINKNSNENAYRFYQSDILLPLMNYIGSKKFLCWIGMTNLCHRFID